MGFEWFLRFTMCTINVKTGKTINGKHHSFSYEFTDMG
jgi:hypothetical protein